LNQLVEQTSEWSRWTWPRLAAAFVAVSEPNRALEVLERAERRGATVAMFLRFPEFDPIRSHPRFQRLVEESRPR
jgi:hypothetical protein